MRMIRAQLKDVYHVHRLYKAYHEDIGVDLDDEKTSNRWISELTNDRKYYMLVLHGRKALGLIWGENLGESFKVEGAFLKRGWRGKFRFSKWIYKALLEKKKKFGKLLITVPAGCEGINTKKFTLEQQIYQA